MVKVTYCKDCKHCKINWLEKLFFGLEFARCEAYFYLKSNKDRRLVGEKVEDEIVYKHCSTVRDRTERNPECSKFEAK